MNRRLLLIVLVLLFVVSAAFIVWPDYTSPHIEKFLILSQAMLVLSLLIFVVGRPFDFEGRNRRLFQFIMTLAIFIRVVLLFGASDKFYLSDDIYRYVWDGKVNASGVNPYLFGPQADELAHLQDNTIYPKINHPWLPTIYPPLAQSFFTATVLVGGDSTINFKLLFALFEALTIWTLLIWFRQIGVARSHMLLWLFSPLVLAEFFLSAHLDILAMPFLIGALLLLNQRRAGMAGLMLALACLVKFIGVLLVPIIFFHFKGKDRFLFGGVFLATIVLCYLPYIVGSEGTFLGSLGAYLSGWEYNASVFLVIRDVLGLGWARFAVAALLAGWLICLLLQKRAIGQKLFWAFGGYIVLTTTLFPWYLVWILPFAIAGSSWAFIVLSGTVLLSYHVFIGVHDGGSWSPMPWLFVVSYLPFYSLLGWSAIKNYRRSRSCAISS